MTIRSQDLIAYAAQYMPWDDTSIVGGVVNPQIRVYFNDFVFTTTDVIELISSNFIDLSITATVTVMTTDGLTLSEAQSLEGIVPVDFNSLGQINRIESVILSSAPQGTVTVRLASNLTNIGTIPPGELGFTRLFVNSFPAKAVIKTYYTKFFWKNTNMTDAMVSGTIGIAPNPADSVNQCIAITNNDAGTSINRITIPDVSVLEPPALFDDVTQNLPNSSTLSAGDSIGVWLSLTLQPSALPMRDVVGSTISGNIPLV